MRSIFLLLLISLPGCAAMMVHYDQVLTRPERSSGQETSTLADVNSFLAALAKNGAPITLGTLGTSAGGLEIPLCVVANPACADGAEARASGRVVVYLQGNIHGGEVEGKEAAQMLLREAVSGLHPSWLEHLVIVCVPVYNVDGNEAFGEGLRNRGHQDGPAIVGQRTNADRLDLNREGIKAESPEFQAVLEQIWKRWDPHAMLDLHTTNGTRHGYALTYSPPLGPDTDTGILTYSRDELLPAVRATLAKVKVQLDGCHLPGIATFDYGGARRGDEGYSWSTFSPLPRYMTNYAGMRNRIGILSEATSFLPFNTRIEATRGFVSAILDKLAADHVRVSEMCQIADSLASSRATGAAGFLLGIKFDPLARGNEEVHLEDLPEGTRGVPHKAPVAIKSVSAEVFDRFVASETRPLPLGWRIPAAEVSLIALIEKHGIEFSRVERKGFGRGFLFIIEERTVAERPFQGHHLVTVDGKWTPTLVPLLPGDVVVAAGQPLGTLAFQILEPDFPDSPTTWGFVDAGEKKSPVMRLDQLP